MPDSRRRTVRTVAAALAEGTVCLDAGADRDETEKKLLGLRGIGPWTAGCIRMRALGAPESCSPATSPSRPACDGRAPTRSTPSGGAPGAPTPYTTSGARWRTGTALRSVTSNTRQQSGPPDTTVDGGPKTDEKEATMIACTTITSPLGDLLLVGEDGADGFTLTSLSMPGQKNAPAPHPGWRYTAEPFADVIRRLGAYWAGEPTRFDIPFTPGGTDFQQRVWRALEEIPHGTTTTYGALTAHLRLPRAQTQAVGAAIGANPLLLARACHRVIGADGSMRGYAGGVERKVHLLTHEGALQPALI